MRLKKFARVIRKNDAKVLACCLRHARVYAPRKACAARAALCRVRTRHDGLSVCVRGVAREQRVWSGERACKEWRDR